MEAAYHSLAKYYTDVLQGRPNAEVPNGSSTNERLLIRTLVKLLEQREELGAFDHILQAGIVIGNEQVDSFPKLYRIAFKRLLDSVRIWRKNSTRGYLNNPVADVGRGIEESKRN